LTFPFFCPFLSTRWISSLLAIRSLSICSLPVIPPFDHLAFFSLGFTEPAFPDRLEASILFSLFFLPRFLEDSCKRLFVVYSGCGFFLPKTFIRCSTMFSFSVWIRPRTHLLPPSVFMMGQPQATSRPFFSFGCPPKLLVPHSVFTVFRPCSLPTPAVLVFSDPASH